MIGTDNTEDEFAKADTLYDNANYTEAFDAFLSLAQSGDVSGMTRVAEMYGAGLGVAYSFEECVRWDCLAAEHGNLVALFNLGISYRNKGDARTAKLWFEKAIRAGDGEATLELAKMYLVSELEVPRAVAYLRSAVKSGSVCEDSREEAEMLLEELTKNFHENS